MEIALSVQVYFSQSETFKDISRYLFFCQKKVEKGEWTRIFLSVDRIAKVVGCSRRTVFRYLKSVDGYPIKITHRKGATNIYEMDKDLFNSLIWLDSRNCLYATESQYKDLLKQAEYLDNHIPLSPPIPYRGCHPSLLLSRVEEKEYGYIHPHIEKIGGLSRQERLSLSQYPEYAIVQGVEDCVWYAKQGNKIENLMAILQSRIKDRMQC